jgi:hypothetical protein
MQTADKRVKAAERAAAVGLITGGLALLGSVLTAEGAELIRWIVLGAGALVIVTFGLHRRALAALNKASGPGLMGFLSIFMPLAGVIVLALGPAAIAIAAAGGISVGSSLLVVGVLLGLGVLANLVILVLNLKILRRKTETQSDTG